MKTFFHAIMCVLAISSFCVSCGKDNSQAEAVQVFEASGDITIKLSEFRTKLGPLNNTIGNTDGRREINWDAVPDSFETKSLPVDFFNPVGVGANEGLQRGFKYSPGADARVSAALFAGLEPSNSTQFAAFSGNKTFSTVASNLWNVEFEVPGQSTPAFVRGFGGVFSDVDILGSTSLQFFSGTESLGIFNVPVATTGSHSFLGVYFPGKKITSITIVQGSASVGPGVKDISVGGVQDIVLMDDFLYSEPKAD